MEKCLAVISRKARNYRKGILQTLDDIFARKDISIKFFQVDDNPEGLEEEVNQAIQADCRFFLAAGGDGTLSRLASFLCNQPHVLGVIPIGTANTMARVLGIPLTVRESAEVASSRQFIRSVDSLEVNNKVYVMNVSVGISSIALKGIDNKQKSRWGILSYAVGVFRNTRKINTNTFYLIIDGKPYTIRAVEVHVTNTGVLGYPQIRVQEASQIDDGKVEVLTLQQWTVGQIIDATMDIVLPRKKQVIKLISKGTDILIDSITPLPVQADGDIIQETPVQIKVHPQAIHFIVPSKTK
jgi:diacylglycerol kinase (ATP)